MTARCCLALILAAQLAAALPAADVVPFPGTQPLTMEGDLASQMVDGIDRFLLREIDESIARRADHWNRDLSSPSAYNESIAGNRQRLAHIVGVRDLRVPFDGFELPATTQRPALVGKGPGFDVFAIRWPVLAGVHGEGLLLVPTGRAPRADVIALPDADQTPEQIAGLAEGLAGPSQFASRLAAAGCRVVVPTLISRDMQKRAPPGQGGRANLTNREYIYRSAFEMGRHLIGYEVQKVLACVDQFEKEAGDGDARIGVIGYGEGGLVALYAAALDPRIDAACVSGYFGPRERIWEQPLDRNVFALLEQFGDAELASMVHPRGLIIDASGGPQLELPGEGGAPAKLVPPTVEEAEAEAARAGQLVGAAPIVVKQASFCGAAATSAMLAALGRAGDDPADAPAVTATGAAVDPAARQQRQLLELDRYNQWLLSESDYVRAEFMKKLDTSSLEAYERSVEWYRDYFRQEVIGHFDQDLLPAKPRSRQVYDEPKWTGYEVVMDVFPDVFAYGILCVPKDLKENEQRPVVVCQHGLEGRPTDVVTGNHNAYHDFAAKLAERGFITFAPQNIYIFRDRFRTLQRKANPLKKTLFSIMVPQHQQIVNWLKSLPMVDDQRIAFYGLSYGGKSAMRIPPLVTDYCLSICSADFNEWVAKNATTRHNFSYVWTGEYEIFEFDLGSTFNYAEMAYLICPRPFMVERGHFDGVGEDKWVAYEYAKIRHMYAAKLFIPDRTEIEWFYGPYQGVHTINGQGTFDFLHRHLDWPRPQE